jgi:hypothetical protein
MVSSQRDGSDKVVVDSIHGDIHLTRCEREVIDTGSFQRLRTRDLRIVSVRSR